MNEDYNENLIRKFIDGELSSDEEADLMRSLADDASFRKMLQLDLLLKQDLKKPEVDSFEVPADFSNNVMQEINVRLAPDAELQKTGIFEKFIHWLRVIFQPRTVSVRLAYGLVVALLLIVFIFFVPQQKISPDQSGVQQEPPAYISKTADEGSSVIWMRFVYADANAKSMAIAGDFNNWQPVQMNRMKENNQTIWTITIPLPHKEIHYMFLKDGKEWLSDPLAPQQQDDGFGHRNSVIPL